MTQARNGVAEPEQPACRLLAAFLLETLQPKGADESP